MSSRTSCAREGLRRRLHAAIVRAALEAMAV
jgi:hypothetical protein